MNKPSFVTTASVFQVSAIAPHPLSPLQSEEYQGGGGLLQPGGAGGLAAQRRSFALRNRGDQRIGPQRHL